MISPPRNSPTPTQTQAQLNPQLSGSASASCRDNGTEWVVELSVTATLTGAPQGDNPQGQAGKSDNLKPFTVNGGGTTSFSGQASVSVGASGTNATGTLQWNVTVTVPGAGPEQDSGTESYNCTVPG